MKYFPNLLIGLSVVLGSCAAPALRMVDRPIVFDEERRRLSLDYMAQRHNIQQSEPFIRPRMIVLHWTAIPTLEGSFRAFERPTLAGARPDLMTAGPLNVSVPFLVDRDGTVYRLMPDTLFARHCIGLNHCAIGVENVGSGRMTRAQVRANAQLVRLLKERYAIDYLIGHYEYRDFIGHPLWKETDPNYLTVKTDPGRPFMRKVRKRVKDLGLKGSPKDE